jgi:putative nucleotidyltransferase with HDIG domain
MTASTAAAALDATAQRLGEQMERIVAKRIEDDKLVLPAMPTVAARCLEMLKDPDMAPKHAAALVEKDPILTAQLLKMANSAALGTREPIPKVLGAIVRLGTQRFRTFLVEAATRKVFESRDALISASCRKIWEHSLAVAAVSADIAALANAGDPETGYLAGLLHDVGKPVVAALLLEAERSISINRPSYAWIGSEEWLRVVRGIHRRVGVALAEKWGLGEQVVRAVRDCEDYDAVDRLSVANAVRLANALVKTHGIYETAIDKDDVGALVIIGQSLLGIDSAVVQQLVPTALAAMADAI